MKRKSTPASQGGRLRRWLWVAVLFVVGAAPARGQSLDDFRHFWFLTNLARCGGDPCVVVSPVFELTAVTPADSLLTDFQERATERFHGVEPQPMVEPAGSRWRDETAAMRRDRIERWRSLGWTVYTVDVAGRRTPDPLLQARADAEAMALAEGYRAESAGQLALALLWYRRAADLADGGVAAGRAIDRIEDRIRSMAGASRSSGGG